MVKICITKLKNKEYIIVNYFALFNSLYQRLTNYCKIGSKKARFFTLDNCFNDDDDDDDVPKTDEAS